MAEGNTYELMYIVNSTLNDEQTKDIVQRVAKYIENGGGEIIYTDEMGSKRLAYPIQKRRTGYYVNLYFKAEGALIQRLERAMEINENILRYLTLRMDNKMIRHMERRRTQQTETPAEA
jgi:small subunit ribosomal protein S6